MTYRLKWIVVAIILWEIIFWGAYFVLTNVLGSNKSYDVDHLLYKQPNTLYLLLLMVPITALFLYRIIRHNVRCKRYSPRVLVSLIRPVSSFSTFIRFFFFRNAFVLLVIALALPVYGSKKVASTSESLELVVCLDISNSMNTMDIASKTTRLDVAKRALVELVNKLGGEKLGLCLFANNAYVHLPITGDYPAIKLFVKDIETDMISNQGTNISTALEASVEMFSTQKTSKGILLITDGENHEQDPTTILNTIREKDIQLMVLGLGTKTGGPVPKDPRRPEIGYKTDALGKTVISRINPSFLKKIAKAGGGESEVSSNEFPDLSGLLTQIKRMKRSKIDNFDFKVKQERYQMPLLAAFACWLMYLLWSAQFVGWLDRFVK